MSLDTEVNMPTERDIKDAKLIRWVARRDMITTVQFERINKSSHEAARKKLERLVNKEYLGKTRFSKDWTKPNYYFATKKGVKFVHSVLEDDGANLAFRNMKDIRPGQIDHKIGINDFFTSLQEQSNKSVYGGLHTWLNSKESKIVVPGEEQRLYPDSFGIFDLGNIEVSFFFEYDRGQMIQKVVLKKLRRYMALIERGGHEELCNELPVNILLLTTYESWAMSLRKQIERAAIKEFPASLEKANFLVSWEGVFHANDILGPNWILCGGNGEKVSFYFV
jgi:hypothetical protein